MISLIPTTKAKKGSQKRKLAQSKAQPEAMTLSRTGGSPQLRAQCGLPPLPCSLRATDQKREHSAGERPIE